MSPLSPEGDRRLLDLIKERPGMTAKDAGEATGVIPNVASNRLLSLFRRGLIGRIKVLAAWKHYESQDLANKHAPAAFADEEKMRRERPVSSISGFTTVGPRFKSRSVSQQFADAEPDYSKAKITVAPPTPSRYAVEPGFKGEFSREWEERRRTCTKT